MTKLIFVFLFCFAGFFASAQDTTKTDTSKITADNITVMRVGQVDYLLKKLQRLQEDIAELQGLILEYAKAGLILDPKAKTPPKKEGKN